MFTPSPSRSFVLTIISVWLLIPSIDMTARLILPPSFYAYRAWEFMTATDGQGGPFKPSSIFQGTIYGDLAHMLHIRKFRRYRHQTFTTDSTGFRNQEPSPGTTFPIVLVGDSNMAGSSLSDKETFGQVLGETLNIPVYNFAPSGILSFLADDRFQKNPPKVVVWEAIERTISADAFKPFSALPAKARFIKNKVATKKLPMNQPKFTEYWSKELFHEIAWRLSGHHENVISHIDKNSGMLFYQLGVQILQQDANHRGLDDVVEGIVRIHQLLADRGINLIFFPLPDKENIYQELLPEEYRPFEHPVYIEKLIATLRNQGISTIDLYGPFRSAASLFLHSRRESDSLYFLDDTHWNANGVTLAVKETLRQSDKLQIISEQKVARP